MAAAFQMWLVASTCPSRTAPVLSVIRTAVSTSLAVIVTGVDGITLVAPLMGSTVTCGAIGMLLVASAAALSVSAGLASDASALPSGPSAHSAPASTQSRTTKPQWRFGARAASSPATSTPRSLVARGPASLVEPTRPRTQPRPEVRSPPVHDGPPRPVIAIAALVFVLALGGAALAVSVAGSEATTGSGRVSPPARGPWRVVDNIYGADGPNMLSPAVDGMPYRI